MVKTKIENKFFGHAENFEFQLNTETGEFSFDQLSNKLNKLLPKFEAEIRQNSTVLNGESRKRYYDGLKEKAIALEKEIRFVNEKPEQWQYNYEGDLIINPPIENNQYISLDKFAVLHEEKEYPLTQKGVEARKKVLVRYKILLIQLLNKYFPDLKEASTIQKKEQTDTAPQFSTKYTPEELGKIFDSLARKKVTKKADKEHFLSIFTNNITGKVYWNSNIHGTKSALFDLIERLTGKQMKTTDLLQLFDTKVNDNNRNITKNDNETISYQTKLVDAIFSESIIKP